MLKRHPCLTPFVATRAERLSAGLDVPLVDEAGKVHVISFEMGAAQLASLAAQAASAAAAMLRQEAHESAIQES